MKSRVHHFVLVELEDKLQNLGELLHEGLVESTLSNFSFVRYLSATKETRMLVPDKGFQSSPIRLCFSRLETSILYDSYEAFNTTYISSDF